MSSTRDIHEKSLLRPPTVPTPDWSIENYGPKNDKNTDEKIQQGNTSQKKEETADLSVVNANRDMDIPQTPQRPIFQNAGSVSSISVMSRVTDPSSTPSIHTPLFNNVNPHSTMSAMTPAASGCDQAKNSIKIQNCVSTVNLGCELKLLDICCRTRYTEYNPSRFQGIVMKIMDPRATALVFRSGKIVCTGARNEHDSYIAARKFARIINKLGYPVKFLEFKVQNFCATADLRFPIRLEALQHAHGQFASYEPELFPGLVYRMVRPRVVLLIFVNGKIVFTGGRSRNDIGEALDIIYPILRSYRIS